MLSHDQLIENMYEPTLYMDVEWEIYILETVTNRYAEAERLEREKNEEKGNGEGNGEGKKGNKNDEKWKNLADKVEK